MIEKTIKVFLASSDELKIDRLEFGDLINRLNNIYRNRGIYIELKKWEGFDASIASVRKQSDYNEVVRDSDVFLALFHTKAGKYTLEEFETALDEFSSSKDKPKIYTYFKELENGQAEEAALVEFKKKLMDEMGHYYCRYGNPDTMMLHFVLQIKVLNLDAATEVKVEDSQITIDGEKVIDLSKIPFLNKNKDYIKLKAQLAELEGKYFTALDRSRKYPDDPSFLAEVIEISETKNTLKKELENLEKNMVGFAEQLLELSARSVISARLRKAQEYFESGDIAGANTVLNFEEISVDIDSTVDSIERNSALIEKTEALIEEGRKQLSIHVDELLMKAETLRLDLSNKNRFAEAEACYAKAADISEKYHLDGKAYLKYGNYLLQQNNYQASEHQCLRYFCWAKEKAKNNPVAYLPDLATSQNNLGLVYVKTNRLQEAEKMYLAALEIRKTLAGQNPSEYLSDVAICQNNLGKLYDNINHLQESEKMHLAALEIWIALSEKNPNAYLCLVVVSQGNLGDLFIKTNRLQEAEKMHLAALATCKALADKNLGAYLLNVAASQNSLGLIYNLINRQKEAEEMYLAALETAKVLAEQNPSAYLHNVATSQNNLGLVYVKTNRLQEAEKMYLAALEIRKTLAEQNPSAYLHNVANSQNSLGLLYTEIKRFKEAEEMHLAALETRRALAKQNPSAYLPEVAESENNLGFFYHSTNRFIEAEEMYLAALKIRIALAKQNPSAYLPEVAESHGNLGVLYRNASRLKEAEDSLIAALEIYSSLLQTSPEVYKKAYESIKRILVFLRSQIENENQQKTEANPALSDTANQCARSEEVTSQRDMGAKPLQDNYDSQPWHKRIFMKKPK